MSPVHDENAFRAGIVSAMVERGWDVGSPSAYRADLGLDTSQLFTFIGETQSDDWNELLLRYGNDPDAAQFGFATRVDQAIKTDGLLHVLRRGVKDKGVLIRLAYFKPSLVPDDSVLVNYRANRLTVVKELEYATKQADAGNRLDLALFLNGIPVATAELKNPLTKQNVDHAKQQYRLSRDSSELIFRHRVVANFAVDPDLVFVATQLRGKKTLFLPFNTGSKGPGEPGGKGNPTPSTPGKHATAYLWEQVWEPDNWLDLLERFVHEQKEKNVGSRSTKTMIYPRYHQWDVVKKLTAHAAIHGAGHNYLVMASAGSGKSNTIGWLAHRLSSLHTPVNPADLDPDARASGLEAGVPVFDKTIVITDRRNLDSQLRETVSSFEQIQGLVVKVDDRRGAKSEQLAKALSSEAGKIITVTLHTFPALIEYLKRNPTEIKGRKFAIIVDEAHSSQSGDAAKDVRAALRDLGLDADDESGEPGAVEILAADTDAKLKQSAAERSMASNLSYFAFTATPKAKTLELFGTLETLDGKPTYVPFHTYSMRQAIEEGFILDPLKNYVTYKTYWRLVNKNADDVEVERDKANKLLARAAGTHPSTAEAQAQIIVEDFEQNVRGRLGGRAKAMVVTDSRRSAVQMSRAIKSYIQDRDYKNLGVLVAFSGTLEYEGEDTTEPKENGGIPEGALRKAFAYTKADDPTTRAGGPGKTEYRILVVAEKYQTGFDQPLLTSMYVNKDLAGISAVQTLSRLNRTADGKSQEDLCVLDFRNEAEDIAEAFRPYYEEAMTLPSDPNLLYTAESKVMQAQILDVSEMQEFAAAYFTAKNDAAGSEAKWQKAHAELYRLLAPAVERFEALANSEDEDEREAAEVFRGDLNDYIRKYGFLSQLIPYQDEDLERLYLYGRHLLNRLPRRGDGGVDIGEVDLSHLRVENTGQRDVSLTPEGAELMKGFGDGSAGAKEPEKALLSELIDDLNTRFGADLTDDDLLRSIIDEMKADPDIKVAALGNPEEDFGLVSDKHVEEKMQDRYDSAVNLGNQYFARDGEFKAYLNSRVRKLLWRTIREEAEDGAA
ncbi:type I restriction endonuclease subunit R [Actinomadura rupiterrae]|uniref:type I restriction endonuclease subunit R n=1 Tax=Actinomadura rupiterrae TaxID=559627 RepID=UPI0020A5BA30|nr:type I restriction endonuclease [Actinomadura rupiterrae]MCP2342027.1 type I restriction enzyme R subunit [Actinomadura rupiterrae]